MDDVLQQMLMIQSPPNGPVKATGCDDGTGKVNDTNRPSANADNGQSSIQEDEDVMDAFLVQPEGSKKAFGREGGRGREESEPAYTLMDEHKLTYDLMSNLMDANFDDYDAPSLQYSSPKRAPPSISNNLLRKHASTGGKRHKQYGINPPLRPPLILPTTIPQSNNNSTNGSALTQTLNSSSPSLNINKQCANCGARNTPTWRRCPEGKLLLCNACGLYVKNHHQHRQVIRAPDGQLRVARSPSQSLDNYHAADDASSCASNLKTANHANYINHVNDAFVMNQANVSNSKKTSSSNPKKKTQPSTNSHANNIINANDTSCASLPVVWLPCQGCGLMLVVPMQAVLKQTPILCEACWSGHNNHHHQPKQ